MKLLVYEMQFCKSDCIFAKQRWSEDEGMWINYCKFNDERCNLDLNEHECDFLKEKKKKNEYMDRLRLNRL